VTGGKQSPTQIGDVLILRTTASYTVYAVGPVSAAGQNDFTHGQEVRHVTTHTEAITIARAMAGAHGRIHLLDIDTAEWSVVSQFD